MAVVNTLGTSNLPEYSSFGYTIPGADLPDQDPRFKDAVNKQKQLAGDFRKNLPQYEDTLGLQYEKQARQNLAQNLKQTKASYNSRGLLRSGGRYGAEANQKQATNYDIAQGRYGINQALDNQANTLDNNYLNSAYGMAGVSPNIGQGLLSGVSNDIGNMMSNNQALNDMFGGFGKGIGAIASGIRNKDK